MKLSNSQSFKLSNLLLAAGLAAFSAQNAFAADVTVQVAAGQESFGKVSGGKANAKEGATLTLKATPAKGYGFAGWFKDSSSRVSWQSSWKYTVGSADETFFAKFVAVQDDDITFSDKQPDGYKFDLDHVPVRDEFLILAAMSEVKLTVSGLPSGIKATYGTVPKTNGSVEFSGTAKKPGVYFVTFTAKNANGYVQSLTQKWVVGTSDDTPPGDFDDIGLDASEFKTWRVGVQKWAHLPSLGGNVAKWAASGLPPGVALESQFNFLNGFPSKQGKYTISLTATMKDKSTKKAKKTIIVSDSGCHYVTVSVPPAYAGCGTAKGSGVYRVGTDFKLTATPASGYCFAGWYTDAACTVKLTSFSAAGSEQDWPYTASQDWRKPSDVMTFYYNAASNARNIYAKFISKGDDYRISLWTSLESKDVCKFSSFPADGSASINYSVDSETLPTVTAKNLPPGFKLDTSLSCIRVDFSKVKPGAVYENVQLIAKNQTGKTDTKTFAVHIGNYWSLLAPNLKTATDVYESMVGEDTVYGKWNDDLTLDDSYGDWKMSVSGLPPGTKAVYDGKSFYLTGIASKSGVYTPIVTFTRGTGVSKQTEKFSFTISVYEQNEALIGTFNGVTSHDAAGNDIDTYSELVTITSAKGGKLSAKVGKKSLSGNGWRYYDKYSCYVAELFAHTKEDGHNIQYMLYVEADPVLKEPGSTKNFTGRFERTDTSIGETLECYFFAKQNWFGHKYWPDDRAAELAAMKTMYFEFDDAGYFKKWNNLVATTDTKAPVKMTVDKKGVMKLSAVLGGKTVSGSTTLLPEADGSLTGYLPVSVKSSCGEGRWIFCFTYKNGVPKLELKYNGGGGCG